VFSFVRTCILENGKQSSAADGKRGGFVNRLVRLSVGMSVKSDAPKIGISNQRCNPKGFAHLVNHSPRRGYVGTVERILASIAIYPTSGKCATPLMKRHIALHYLFGNQGVQFSTRWHTQDLFFVHTRILTHG
jgi:hypothetical protein